MKRCYTALILILITLSLTACGSFGGSSKKSDIPEIRAAEKPKVDNRTKVSRNWSRNLGKKIDENAITISPQLYGDKLYAASANGLVHSFVASDGKQVWRTKIKEQITAGVGVGSGMVAVGTSEGKVHTFSSDNGQELWTQQMSSEVLASPVISGQYVLVRTGDGKLAALSTYDGSQVWSISRKLPKLSLRGDSPPLVMDNVVLAGFPDGFMVAVDLQTGRALWNLPVAFAKGRSEIERLSDIDSTPLLVGNNIYVTSYQDVTRSLDMEKQKMSWRADVSSYHPLAYDESNLYITNKEGLVSQINRFDGTIVWTQDALKLRGVSAPASIGPYVAVSDSDGELYLLDKVDGSLAGRHKLGAKSIVGQPIVQGQTMFFIDTSGSLKSINVQ